MFLISLSLLNGGSHTGSEIPNECARQVNQFIEPGSLQTPIAFVDKPSNSSIRGTGSGTSNPHGTINSHPRTACDIGYMDGEFFFFFELELSFFLVKLLNLGMVNVSFVVACTESQLRALLAELTNKCPVGFGHLELEQLQFLVCKQLGLPTVSIIHTSCASSRGPHFSCTGPCSRRVCVL